MQLLKPEESMSDEVFQKQSDFARMAFGDTTMNVTRDRNFFSQVRERESSSNATTSHT